LQLGGLAVAEACCKGAHEERTWKIQQRLNKVGDERSLKEQRRMLERFQQRTGDYQKTRSGGKDW